MVLFVPRHWLHKLEQPGVLDVSLTVFQVLLPTSMIPPLEQVSLSSSLTLVSSLDTLNSKVVPDGVLTLSILPYVVFLLV